MYTIDTEDQLIEFAELCQQYPNQAAVDVLIKAGGRDDAYRYVGCTWCDKWFPYESGDDVDQKRADGEANAHALTCEKDPRAAELAALRQRVAELEGALSGYYDAHHENARRIGKRCECQESPRLLRKGRSSTVTTEKTISTKKERVTSRKRRGKAGWPSG